MTIRRNLSTPEWRAFWACAEEASKRVERWPAWKVSRQEQDARETAPAGEHRHDLAREA